MSTSIANELRKEIFDMPLLLDEEVFSYISLIDTALYAAARSLWPGTGWFLRYFGELTNKTLFTSFRNQRMFQTSIPRSARAKTKGRQPPVQDLYSDDERSFLLAINRSAMHAADQAVPPPPVEGFRLFRRTLVECLEGFLRLIGAKPASTSNSTLTGGMEVEYLDNLHRILRDISSQEPEIRGEVALALARKKHVEDAVGAIGDRLYCTVIAVTRHIAGFLELRSQLCSPYLRKVWSVVREHRIRQNDQRFMALFNWGVTGLTTAVNCFDHRRATSFGRFAEWWIKQRILSYHKGHLNLITQDSKHIQVRTRIRSLLRDKGWSELPMPEMVTNLAEAMNMERAAVVQFLHDDTALSSVVSLNVTYGEDDSRTSVGDMIHANDSDSAEHAEQEMDHVKAISRLSERLPWDHVRLLLMSTGQEGSLMTYHRPNAKSLVRMAVSSIIA